MKILKLRYGQKRRGLNVQMDQQRCIKGSKRDKNISETHKKRKRNWIGHIINETKY